MTTRTEQEIRRSAPARGAGTPKNGTSRSGSAAKPVPRPRPAAADSALQERTRTKRPDDVRDERSVSTRTKRPEGVRAERPARTRATRPEGARRPATARRGPARRQRGPFMVLVLGLLGGGLVSLLLLNTVLAQDSIRAGNLKSEIAQLELELQRLDTENERRQQPGEIAKAGINQGQKPDWAKPNVISPATEDTSKVGANR